MRDKIIIVGSGGHAKVIADSIMDNGEYDIYGFIDFHEEKYMGIDVIGKDEDLKKIYDKGIKKAVIGIGYMGKGDIRNKIYSMLKEIGYELPCIIDNSAILSKSTYIGEGVYVGKRAVVNSKACIGKMSIINTGAIVEHDCHIGEYSHIAIGALLCGEVRVGKNTFIGAGAVVRQSTCIGDYVTVGAGTTLIKNVCDNLTIVNKLENNVYENVREKKHV